MSEGQIIGRAHLPEADVARLLAMLEGAPLMDLSSAESARAQAIASGPMLYLEVPALDERRTTVGDVPVRIYRPRDRALDELLPTLIYFHGGGWTMGDLDGFAPMCATWADEAGLCVVSVDYRLAPEHPFPAAIEDALSVARGVGKEAAALGIDGARIAVGGDSAGGNIAAVLCLCLRDNVGAAPGFAIRFQLLLYPVTDLRFARPSYAEFGERYLLTSEMMRWFAHQYVPLEGERSQWRVSPLLADSLAGLPPAHILTCGLDPLQDEGRAYADRLEREGIDVTRRHYAGQIHGFLFMGKVIRRTQPALLEIAQLLRSALDRGD